MRDKIEFNIAESESINKITQKTFNEKLIFIDDEIENKSLKIEKSPTLRFHKRNQKYFHSIMTVHESYLAIEPKSGKQFVWNEIFLQEIYFDIENKILSLIKHLRTFNHPFILRFYEEWICEDSQNRRKLIFITERINIPTMMEYVIHTSVNQRLHDKISWRKMSGQILSAMQFLHHNHILHNDITIETVYQSNGIVKIGLGAVNFFSNALPLNGICNFGKLILEMCAYHHPDIHNQFQTNSVPVMIQRISCKNQKDFITSTFNQCHLSFAELVEKFQWKFRNFPNSLKLLAGFVIVDNIQAERNFDEQETDTTLDQPLTYKGLCDSQHYHFDNETVLASIGEMNGNKRLLKWEEFLLGFSTLPKFLMDIRNGFYNVFGYKNEPTNFCGDLLDLGVASSLLNPCSENLDCVSVDNEEYFKTLEVKDKIYSRNCNASEIICNPQRESGNILELNGQVDSQSGLIESHSPVVIRKIQINSPYHLVPVNDITDYESDATLETECKKFNGTDIIRIDID